MGFRGRLVVFGYPALEILTAWGIASLIGWGWTILLLFAGLPFGLLLMRDASRRAVSQFRAAAQTGAVPQGSRQIGTRFAAGLLLAVPGLWSDLVAVLVLLPWTGGRLSRLVPAPLFTAAGSWTWQGGGMSATSWGSEVVPGQVVNRTAGPPQTGGPAGEVSG